MLFTLAESYGRHPLTEQELQEATFSGENHLNLHYGEHVLKQDEQFSREDPKFPYMSKEEYAKAAEELSLSDAGIVETVDDLKNARGIIGWVADDQNWRSGPRCIKIKTDSEKVPGYLEIVGYVDDPARGNQVFTYMLARRSKKYREFSRKIAELPENLEKVVDIHDTM